jgi:phospholipid/cholesterol/gamma-HCH transport system permease protein
MTQVGSTHGAIGELVRSFGGWLGGWWRIVHLGAVLFALGFSRASYGTGNRRAMARHIYLHTAPSLLWFSVLVSLLSLVLIRIVVVTSISYGLPQYALEMVVRVLVLELIPLTAAVFAALRCTIPLANEISAMRTDGRWDAVVRAGADPLQTELLPRAVAGVFCALMLAAVNCVVALLLAYFIVYGATVSGFPAYTHTVGQIFTPAVTLIFVFKIVLFGVAVAVTPLASMLYDVARHSRGTSAELRGLVRMFVVILLIEIVSLVGNYY